MPKKQKYDFTAGTATISILSDEAYETDTLTDIQEVAEALRGDRSRISPETSK